MFDKVFYVLTLVVGAGLFYVMMDDQWLALWNLFVPGRDMIGYPVILPLVPFLYVGIFGSAAAAKALFAD